jgi:hypothetical protein
VKIKEALWECLEKNADKGFGYRRNWSWRSNRLVFATRENIIMWFFLPHLFMCMGTLFMGLAGLACAIFGWTQVDLPLPVGVILTLVGAFLTAVLSPTLLGRRAVCVDGAKGMVKVTIGLRLLVLPLLPIMSKRQAFRDFSTVRLLRNGTLELELVRDKGEYLKVAMRDSPLRVRNWAEAVAKVMQLPLLDETASPSLLRRPEELDLPLRDREDEERGPETTHPPKRLLGRYETAGSEAQVYIERGSERFGRAVLALLAALAVGLLSHLILPDEPTRPIYVAPVETDPSLAPPPSLWPYRIHLGGRYVVGVIYIVSWIAGVFSLLALLGMAANRRDGYRIRAGPEGLAVRRFGLLALRWR